MSDRRLRLGPVQIVVTTQWDDGELLAPAENFAPIVVSLEALRGSSFFDQFMEQWPAQRATVEAAQAQAEVPDAES